MKISEKLINILEEVDIQYSSSKVVEFLAGEYNIEDWFDDGDFIGEVDVEFLYGRGVHISDVEPYDIDILSNSDADDAFDESIDSYISDCLFTQEEENSILRTYFNEEDFKEDCRMDGYHHSLSSYDGGGSENGNFYSFHN